MRYLSTIITILILASCSLPEDPDIGVLVSCKATEVERTSDGKICVRIDSQIPSVKVCTSDGKGYTFCLTVVPDYYQCINLSLYDDLTILEVWAGSYCRIEINR